LKHMNSAYKVIMDETAQYGLLLYHYYILEDGDLETFKLSTAN